MSGLLKFGEQKRIIEQQKKNKKPAWELNYNLNDTLCVIEFIIQEEEQRNNWFRTIRSHNNLDSERMWKNAFISPLNQRDNTLVKWKETDKW